MLQVITVQLDQYQPNKWPVQWEPSALRCMVAYLQIALFALQAIIVQTQACQHPQSALKVSIAHLAQVNLSPVQRALMEVQQA